jgi:hypothetical protein
MPSQLVIRRAQLPVAAETVEALRAFYADWGADGLTLSTGPGEIEFVPADGRPFHHFALLVPGGRFEAAREWVAGLTPLLAEPGSTETTFDFDDWDALACYVEDPAGNIVELIAHAELCPSDRSGPFDPGELCGISEMGLVVHDRLAARATLAASGLVEWSAWGGPDPLSFIGRKGHTLILASPPRGWLPTWVPAVACPASVEIGEISVAVRDGVLTASVAA